MAKIKTYIVEKRYDLLSFVIIGLYFLAGIICLGGVVLWLTSPKVPAEYGELGAFMKFMTLLPLFGGFMIGFLLMVNAQMLQVFLDMEENQRETIELLKLQIEALPDPKSNEHKTGL